jgi:hypothetical protein
MQQRVAAILASEEPTTLWAKLIALSARNRVEDLHTQGAFTDQQAPALNSRLRNHAYQALVAIKRMDSRHDDNPFTAYLLELIDDWEQDPVCAAVSAAVANAVWEFAAAEAIDAHTAARLEEAAVAGTLEVIDLYYRLDEREARRRLACLMVAIPKYWEPPQPSEAFQALLAAR